MAQDPLWETTSVEIVDKSMTIIDLVEDRIRRQDSEGVHDPFYIVNLSHVVSMHEQWTRLFPRVTPFYAVKCFNDDNVLRVLANLGTGFDCASENEIAQVLSLGVAPDRIVYANICKQSNMIARARDLGVDLMVFDNEDELRKIKNLYPAARLLLRILPPVTDNVARTVEKFGCLPCSVRSLLMAAKGLGLNVAGVSFHVGHGCFDPSGFAKAVEAAANAFDVATEVGFDRMSVLDIGGGFPHRENVAITAEQIAAVMVPALDRFFPEERGVRIISEPGRFFVTSALQLTAKIIGKRLDYGCAQSESGEPPRAGYYINVGTHSSFQRAALCKQVPEPVLVSASSSSSSQRALWSVIFGPTCDGLDVVLEGSVMREAFVDDWFSFPNMGAYTLSTFTSFNGMPKPRLYYVGYRVE